MTATLPVAMLRMRLVRYQRHLNCTVSCHSPSPSPRLTATLFSSVSTPFTGSSGDTSAEG